MKIIYSLIISWMWCWITPVGLYAQSSCQAQLQDLLTSCQEELNQNYELIDTQIQQLKALAQQPNCPTATRALCQLYVIQSLSSRPPQGTGGMARLRPSDHDFDQWNKEQYLKQLFSALHQADSLMRSPSFKVSDIQASFFLADETGDLEAAMWVKLTDLSYTLSNPGYRWRISVPAHYHEQAAVLYNSALDRLMSYLEQKGTRGEFLEKWVEITRMRQNLSNKEYLAALWKRYDEVRTSPQATLLLYHIACAVPSFYPNQHNQQQNQEAHLTLDSLYRFAQAQVVHFPKAPYTCELINRMRLLGSACVSTELKHVYPSKGDIMLNFYSWLNQEVKIELYLNGQLEMKRTFYYSDKVDFRLFKDSLHLRELDYGSYKLVLQSVVKPNVFYPKGMDPQVKQSLIFQVSNLTSVMTQQDSMAHFWVGNLLTGANEKQVRIEIFEKNYGKNLVPIDTLWTDAQGEALCSRLLPNKNYTYRIQKGADRFHPQQDFYLYLYSAKSSKLSVDFLLDRPIYEPGDSLKFGCIITQKYPYCSSLQAHYPQGHPLVVNVLSPLGKILFSQTLHTNAWGFTSTGFQLPTSLASGSYRIETPLGSEWFEVAHFAAPTFTIALDQQREGERGKVIGTVQSLVGVSPAGSRVSYEIREMGFNSKVLATGEEFVNDQGQFQFLFDLETEESYHRVELICEVTSPQGETRDQRLILATGRAYRLSIDFPNARWSTEQNHTNRSILQGIHLERQVVQAEDGFPLLFYAFTPQGDTLAVKADLSLYSPQDTTHVIDLGSVISGEEAYVLLPDTILQHKQWYVLELKAKNQVLGQQSSRILVAFFNPDRPLMPYESSLLVLRPNQRDEVADKAVLFMGSSEVERLQLMLAGLDGFWIKQQVDLSPHTMHKMNLQSLLDEHGQLSGSVSIVSQGQLVLQHLLIRCPEPTPTLRIKAINYQPAISPQDTIAYQFQVVNGDGQGVLAHVSASLYNQALDEVCQRDWSYQFFSYLPRLQVRSYYDVNRFLKWTINLASERKDYLSLCESESYLKSRLKDFCYPAFEPRLIVGYGLQTPRSLVGNQAEMESHTLEANQVFTASDKISASGPIQIREHLSHGGYFAPELVTDSMGYFTLSFVAPDRIATWNLDLLAYDMQGRHVVQQRQVVTQQPLSIEAYLPKFLRNRDKAELQVAITQTSPDNPSGVFSYRIYDVVSGVEIVRKQLSYPKGKSQPILMHMHFTVPRETTMLGFDLIVDNNEHQDAVRHLLPVFPIRKLLTRARAFNIVDQKEAHVTFDSFMKDVSKTTIKNVSYTVEYNNAPIYSLLEILPIIDGQKVDYLTNALAVYYFNTLMRHLSEQPAYQKVIQYYREADTLSHLQLHEFLKVMPLDQTPWLMDALGEQGKRSFLAQAIAQPEIAHKRKISWEKILELQQADGGFVWSKMGGKSQVQLTLQVLKMFARLSELNALQRSESQSELIYRAVNFSDSVALARYESDNNETSSYHLEWLYVRSFYRDIPFKGQSLDVSKQVLASIAKQEFGPFQLQVLARAVSIYSAYGMSTEAKALSQELLRRSTRSYRHGVFWANNVRNVADPVRVQVSILQALLSVDAPQDVIDGIKYWLMTQKQRQMWDGIPATADAIFGLFIDARAWEVDHGDAQVQVGDYLLSATRHFGRIDTTFYGRSIHADLGELTVRKSSKDFSYGTLYWQYFDDIDQLQYTDHEMSVERKVYKSVRTDKGVEYIPLDQLEKTIQVGDRLQVELWVEAERDFDFVVLTDERAACFTLADYRNHWGFFEGGRYTVDPQVAATHFYFDHLPKGKHRFSYEVRVAFAGDYRQGIAQIESYYAPGFRGHTAGNMIQVAPSLNRRK